MRLGAAQTVNWGFFFLRLAIGLSVLTVLFVSQRFWYRAIWHATANWRVTALRVAARLVYMLTLLAILLTVADSFRMGHRHLLPREALVAIFSGLWFTSALFAFLAVKAVRLLDRLWSLGRRLFARPAAAAGSRAIEKLADPSRRYFFRAATMAAGATPFLGVMYGYAAERLNYQVRRVEIPIAQLPSALDGMKIAQLSDIHLSGYMPRTEVRRAVDMANDLGADLAVVTGDFITGAGDPLADCIEEIRNLHAPLGIWGCNGNHEIYAKAEDAAERLFAQAGMKLLRQANAQVSFNGAALNLIGVDYQRERTPGGLRQQTLNGVEALVRRDMPNILLSHNPNSFNRAAEMGIELSLAGHTHGGQVQVEILDHRLSPARFITDYVAGLFARPMFAPAPNARDARHQRLAIDPSAAMARIYVNRGLGTVGAPVRLGVPPEITLIVLRRA
jgi:predicted MPP superfamily phosphohydrolase